MNRLGVIVTADEVMDADVFRRCRDGDGELGREDSDSCEPERGRRSGDVCARAIRGGVDGADAYASKKDEEGVW